MAHTDLIRTNDGMPVLPDLKNIPDAKKLDALYAYIRQQQDYIVRLKEQIGVELRQSKEG